VYHLVDQPTNVLSRSGHFLLWAMRGWRHAAERGACPPLALHQAFTQLNLRPMLPDFHIAMALLHHGGAVRLGFSSVDAPAISEDEAVLLGLWRDVAADENDKAQGTLVLLTGKETATPSLRAMRSTLAHLRGAGFDVSRLSLAH